jgi:hypothetical protein
MRLVAAVEEAAGSRQGRKRKEKPPDSGATAAFPQACLPLFRNKKSLSDMTSFCPSARRRGYAAFCPKASCGCVFQSKPDCFTAKAGHFTAMHKHHQLMTRAIMWRRSP